MGIEEKNVLKKGYELSWGKRFSNSEMALLVLALFSPILLLQENEGLFILYIILFISAVLSVRDKIISLYHHWSLLHKIVLVSSFLVLFSMIVFLLLVKSGLSINNLISFFIILIGFLAFLTVLCISSLLTLNILFFIVLKFIFPQDNGTSGEVLTYRLKDLSPFMSLPNQVAYLLLRIFYFILYLIFISMVFGWIAKFSDENSRNSEIATIEKWIVNSGLITWGNTMGILSIMLTLLTITIPISYKIINVASTEYELHRRKKNLRE